MIRMKAGRRQSYICWSNTVRMDLMLFFWRPSVEREDATLPMKRPGTISDIGGFGDLGRRCTFIPEDFVDGRIAPRLCSLFGLEVDLG